MNFTKKLGLTALTLFTAATINTASSQTLEEYKQMYEESQKTVTALQNELSKEDIKNINYENENDKLKSENEILRKQNKTYKKGSAKKYIKQIEALVADTTAQGIENRKLQTELAKKTKNYLVGAENQAKELVSEREKTNKIKVEAKKYIANLNDSISSLNEKIASIQAQTQAQTQTIPETYIVGGHSIPADKIEKIANNLLNEKNKLEAELKNANQDTITTSSANPKIVYQEKDIKLNGKKMPASKAFDIVANAYKIQTKQKDSLENLLNKYTNLTFDVAGYKLPLKKTQNALTKLYNKNQELTAEKTKLEGIIAGKRDSENKTNFDKAQENQIKYNETKRELDKCQSEIKTQKDSIYSLNKIIDATNNKLNTALANKDNKELYAQINTLEDQVAKTKRNTNALINSAIKAQQKDKKIYLDSIAKLNTQLETIETKLTGCKQAYTQTSNEKKELISDYENKLAQATAQAKTAQSKLAQATAQAKTAQPATKNISSNKDLHVSVVDVDGKEYILTAENQVQAVVNQLSKQKKELLSENKAKEDIINRAKIIIPDLKKQLTIYEDSIAGLNKEVDFQTDYTTAQAAKIKELENKSPEKQIVYVRTSNGNTTANNNNNNPYIIQIDLQKGTIIPPIGQQTNYNKKMIGFFIENYLAGELNMFKDVMDNSNPTEAKEDRVMFKEYINQYNSNRTDNFYIPKKLK